MDIKKSSYIILGVLGLVLSLQQAWVPGFFADGYLYAAFGKNAALKNFWLIPHLNESLYPEFFHHTPFLFIIEGLFFKIFGASYVSARIFSGLFYLGTGLLIFNYLVKKTTINPYFPVLLFLTIPPLFKKVRFPNLDIALMLTFFVAFIFYRLLIRTNKKQYSYLLGFFFGLSLLIKGPVGLLIPLAIIIDLIYQKKVGLLKSIHPWLGLALGFLVFALWPISLYLTDNMNIFHKWYEFTFLHTIRDARGTGQPWFTYLVFLLKSAPIWFLLAIFSIRGAQKSELVKSAITFFFTILFFFSIAKFKYSNYLIPLYPFMGIMGGHFLNELLPEKLLNRVVRFFNWFIPVTALCLLIFPLTTKVRRDREIFSLRDNFESIGFKPTKWTIINEGYPYYALAALNEWEDGSLTYTIHESKKEDCFDCVFIVKDEVLESFQSLNPNFKSIATFKRYGSTVLIPIMTANLPLNF